MLEKVLPRRLFDGVVAMNNLVRPDKQRFLFHRQLFVFQYA
jgi:hypothetical protein